MNEKILPLKSNYCYYFLLVMAPKDLKAPFSFKERRPCYADSVFYVPIYYQEHASFLFPDFEEIFGNKSPVSVEYCSGNGDWIVEKAKEDPFHNWIAVEKRFERVRKIWSKVKLHGLNNVLIVSGEAATFTRHYLPANTLEGAYINFPDPWPKGKHAKNRLIQRPFVDEMARILKKGKALTLVTDDADYVQQAAKELGEHTDFTSVFPPPYFTHALPNYGSSWFESLWREKGRAIHYMQFSKE